MLTGCHRRAEGYYSCTCPSWRNLGGSERQRTCAHLKALLGLEYEEARIKKARSESPTTVISTGKARVKRKETGEVGEGEDSDLFPTSSAESFASQGKRAKKLTDDFNERRNNGPRDLNGGVSVQHMRKAEGKAYSEIIIHSQRELLLAMKWPEEKDPKGYWLSEKLDGVRAWWDGQKMWSRTGRAWNPPQWFMDRLPKDLHLDGELWMKRDAFDETSGICRRSDTDGWNRINFMVFDITNISLLYEERLKELKRRLPDGEETPDEIDYHRLGGRICVLPAVQCTGKEHLNTLMSHIMDKGGEGLMLRQPKSTYEFRRSKTLYKLKYWYDAEGLVVGHEWGQGEHKGRMGAVRIQMECGKTLTVGSGFSFAQRDSWQPTIGKVIRYRFQELTHDGFPRFPIYEGTAPDKTKAKDAIVRSSTFRANAKAEDLERALADFGRKEAQNADVLSP